MFMAHDPQIPAGQTATGSEPKHTRTSSNATGYLLTLSAGASEGQRAVHLVLDLDERVQNHRPAAEGHNTRSVHRHTDSGVTRGRLDLRVQVHLVRLHARFVSGGVWIPAVDLELLDSGLSRRRRRCLREPHRLENRKHFKRSVCFGINIS